MRVSQLLIPTLREDPGEAETVSHRLMLRAGMIRKVAAGIYTYLPLGLRVIRKIERIIREEMDRAGAQELLMPIASPAELWRETGRWDFYGKELLRFQDRHERDFCLGPTHEEVITDLIRREVHSYRQLPLNCYQIETKFRDEIRPRFGLMRGREFIMKDAYSFDKDEEGARLSYQKMYDAYVRIFTRCGLTFRPVEADTGLIGGTSSHEFMVLAETGEETIVYAEHGTYAANVERAEVLPPKEISTEALRPLRKLPTPGARTVEEVTAILKTTPQRLVKTLLYTTPKEPVAVLVRGDHAVAQAGRTVRVPDEVEAIGERVEADHIDVDDRRVGFRVRQRAEVRGASLEEELLAVEEREHHPLLERGALLREHARVLEERGRSRAVVVRAGSIARGGIPARAAV